MTIRDNTRDILLESIRIEDATQGGICTRNSTVILVKDGEITNAPGNDKSICYRVRETSDFQASESRCNENEGELYHFDGSDVPSSAFYETVRSLSS